MSQQRYLRAADITVDVLARKVYKNQQQIKLSDLSVQTLLVLMQAHPQNVTIQQLIDQVWQQVTVSTETVTQRIAMLRKALDGTENQADKYIMSVRNQGYRWVPLVKSTTNRSQLKNKWALLALLAVTVMAPLFWFLSSQRNDPSQQQAMQTPTTKIAGTVSPQITTDELVQQGWLYLQKHEADSTKLAEKLFRQALLKAPNNPAASVGLSFALSHLVTKFNFHAELLLEAKALAHQVVKHDSQNPQAWAALAFAYDANGEIDEATVYYEKALQINPNDASTASSLAYLYAIKGRLVDALRLNLASLGSQQLYLNLQIAQVLDLLGFDAVAERWYAKAEALAPDNVFATHVRARYYLARNDQQKAEQLVDAAINRGVERPELPLIKGIIAWLRGDRSQAQGLFVRAVQIDPDNAEANVWMFMATHPLPVSDAVLQDFANEWFVAVDTWPDMWVIKAMFYAHYGDHDLALRYTEQAFSAGYRNHRWLSVLSPFQTLNTSPNWQAIIATMQQDVSNQRASVLQADWLPTAFLDPQDY